MNSEQSTQLKALFAASDHSFIRGNVYLTEDAICNRLDMVDPAWSFELVKLERRDKQVTAHGRLTVCGVSRENTGMAAIEYLKDNPDREASEPEKAAATDALKRCARLFGVGRYMLSIPRNVKDHAGLERWLNANGRPVSNGTQPLTPDQWGALQRLGKRYNMTAPDCLEALQKDDKTVQSPEDYAGGSDRAMGCIIAYGNGYQSENTNAALEALKDNLQDRYEAVKQAADAAVASQIKF